MAITVKHKFVSAIPDAGDPTIVQPSNWNDTHDLVGTVPIANGGTNATTAADALTNLGAYPASNPAGYGTGSVTSVAATAGTGIAVTGSPITTSGTLNITNTAPDQTVVLTAGTGISTSGTYPNFTITNTSPSSGGTVTSVTGTSPVVSSGGNTPAISLATGYGDTLNPYASKTANYVLAAPSGSAGVPTFRALTATDIPSLSGTYIPYTGASTSIDLNAQTVTNIAHLGINTTSVPTILMRAIGDNNSGSRIAMRGYSSNASSSAIRVTKFRGTFAAPQAPQSGDSLGKFELAGYGTTSSDGYPQASYEGVATEAWGATARGTKTLLYVTPNTTTTQAVALTLDQDKSATFAGALSVTGHTTFEGVTSTGATGTGKLVYDTSPTLVTPLLGTPTSGNFSTGTFTWPTFNQNTTGSAAKWTTARTESLTGDITGSTTVDGSANYSINTTLATVNSNVGTYTKITINGKGLATAGSQASLTDLSSPTASFSFNSQNLTNLLDPVNAQDAATKLYVDNTAQGLDAKASVICATTANISLTGTQTIDGIAVVAGNRVLVKNQTAPAENGIYVASASTWSRSTDMDTWAEVPNSYVWVETGTTQADTGWVCTSNAGGTIGTTAITWVQFAGAGSYTAGTGLTLTGTQFSITNAGTAGTYGSATQTPVFITNAQGQVTSVTNTTITPAVGSITGLGTGVSTALGVNTGSTGAFLVNGGALGTPSSGTVTNLTGTASININGTVGATTATTGAFTTVSASGVITSTVATGTAPFTVSSTTAVANLSIGGNAATATSATSSTTATNIAGGIASQIPYQTGAGATSFVANGTSGQVLQSNGTSAPSWTTNITGNAANVTGTVAIANGGTGQTTAAAAYNALTPLTTAGDIVYEASANTAARLPIGTTGQVLTVAGGAPSWAAASSSNITAQGLYENSATISANYTIGTGNNAMSAGPITVNTGVTVTVPTGSTWVIV